MIQFTSIKFTDEKRWVFDWTPTSATYYRIILYGMELDQVTAPPYTLTLVGWETFPPPIEVAEETALVLSEQNPPFLTIQWYEEEDAGVIYYTMRQLVGADWVDRTSLMEDGYTWAYTVQTPLLADEMLHKFRIVAIDSIEQESDPTEFDIFMITTPILDLDTITIDYTKPNIVIDAA